MLSLYAHFHIISVFYLQWMQRRWYKYQLTTIRPHTTTIAFIFTYIKYNCYFLKSFSNIFHFYSLLSVVSSLWNGVCFSFALLFFFSFHFTFVIFRAGISENFMVNIFYLVFLWVLNCFPCYLFLLNIIWSFFG